MKNIRNTRSELKDTIVSGIAAIITIAGLLFWPGCAFDSETVVIQDPPVQSDGGCVVQADAEPQQDAVAPQSDAQCPNVPFYKDADGDGYGDSSFIVAYNCYNAVVPGASRDGGDCRDWDANVYPGHGCLPCTTTTYYRDSDSDGYGDVSVTEEFCVDYPLSGYVLVGGDCDDSDPAVHPGATEVCNGKDDNCNGQVDESDPLMYHYCVVEIVYTDHPVPTRGRLVCAATSNGVQMTCQPVFSSVEFCGDGLDNNGDGKVDEACECVSGETRTCYSGPANTAGVGLCKAGTQTCEGGYWGTCLGEVLPQTEVCDGQDHNCDGTAGNGCECTNGATRECYSGPAGTKNVGLCKAGTQACANGHWGACSGEVLPQTEVCDDGLDQNCNGQADEGCNPQPPAKVELLLAWTVPVGTVLTIGDRISLYGCWGTEDQNGQIVCEGPGTLPSWGVLVNEVTGTQCITVLTPGVATVTCKVWVPHGKVLRFNSQYGSSSQLYGCNVQQYGGCTNLPSVRRNVSPDYLALSVSVKYGPGTYDANWQVSVQ